MTTVNISVKERLQGLITSLLHQYRKQSEIKNQTRGTRKKLSSTIDMI